MTDPSVVAREVDARFWALGYRPGHKLDPSDPQDAKMIPVWLDIEKKVKAEDAAGKLVITYDHPVVAQGLAAAHAADQEAVAHLDAATKASDPATAQHHVHAAHDALKIGKVKVQDAAAVQPPTASPQLTHEAAHAAAASPPPPNAPASAHVAHVQAQAVHKAPPRGLLEKETDARFWMLGFRPGQKLDPRDPVDAKMIPVWFDIYRKVKAEYDAGKLVITYNHPVVAQNLADAEVADKVAAMHLDAAAASPDPQVAQQNAAAAATAAQVSALKTREAAAAQPPSVSPTLAQDAAKKASAEHHPSPSGRDQLAQVQARGVGGKAAEAHHDHRHHGHRPRSTVSPQRIREHRSRAAQAARAAGAPYVLVIEHPDGSLDHRTFATRAELEAEYAKIAELHDQYRYVAAFDVGASAAVPVVDSVGVPAAEHAEMPPPPDQEGREGRRRERGHGRRGSGDHRGHYGPSAPPVTEAAAPPGGGPPEAAPPEAAPSEGAPSDGASSPETPSPEEGKPKSSIGKIVAIVAAVAAGGGLLYAVTRKPSRGSSSSPSRGRSRTPKVIVATPTTSSSARMSPGLPVRALRA